MRLGYHANGWGGVVGHPAGVTSVKDLYYLTPGSTEAAVAEIAAAGYEGCELFDGNLVEYAEQPDRLRATLDDLGVELVAVYAGANLIFPDVLADELWRIERAATLAADIGAEHLVVGGGAVRAARASKDDLGRLAAALDTVQELGTRLGLTPSYHPHLGTLVEAPEALHALMERTRIGLCPDTAHLAAGGGDPAEIVRRYADRIPYVHLKDLSRRDGAFVPLGAGDLDMNAIVAALDEAGYDGWITVEADGYPGDPGEAARQSAAFLAGYASSSPAGRRLDPESE